MRNIHFVLTLTTRLFVLAYSVKFLSEEKHKCLELYAIWGKMGTVVAGGRCEIMVPSKWGVCIDETKWYGEPDDPLDAIRTALCLQRVNIAALEYARWKEFASSAAVFEYGLLLKICFADQEVPTVTET